MCLQNYAFCLIYGCGLCLGPCPLVPLSANTLCEWFKNCAIIKLVFPFYPSIVMFVISNAVIQVY